MVAMTREGGTDSSVAIRHVVAPDDLLEFRRLVRAYAREVDVHPCFTELEAELAALPQGYLALLFAEHGGHAVGCVALKAVDGERIELVRLYVEPNARGLAIGQRLVEAGLKAAGEAGCRTVVLHTLKRWEAATALYRHLGFVPAAPYCDVPLDDVVFMEYPFTKPGAS